MRLTQALGKGTGLLGFGGMPKQSGRDSRALLAHALGMPPNPRSPVPLPNACVSLMSPSPRVVVPGRFR